MNLIFHGVSMNRLHAILVVFAALGISLVPAAFAAPKLDAEYKLINPPQPVNGKTVEVLEFFSYACPHCAEFEPALQAWLKRKPKDVDVRIVPVVFRDEWKPGAKLYYTLEVMGALEKYHQKVFDAFHKEGKNLTTDKNVKSWAREVGLDPVKFDQTYDSFAVDSKVQRAIVLGRSYKVQFTPSIAVNGKYYTGPSMVAAGTHNYNAFFGVVDDLIGMERR